MMMAVDAGCFWLCGLAVMIVGTFLVCLPWGRPRPRLREVAWEYLAVGIISFLLLSPTHHACHEGGTYLAQLVGIACLVPVIGLGVSVKLRRISEAGIILGALLLASIHQDMVHSSTWTGNPNRRDYLAMRTDDNLVTLIAYLQEKYDYEENVYPAGWVEELPFWAELTTEEKRRMSAIGWTEVVPVWHTRVSDLWREEFHQSGFWFPGGTLAEGAIGISTRNWSGE